MRLIKGSNILHLFIHLSKEKLMTNRITRRRIGIGPNKVVEGLKKEVKVVKY